MARTPTTMSLKFAHYSDLEKLYSHDVFEQDHDVIAGPAISLPAVVRAMRVLAYEAGYTFFIGPAGMLAVKKSLITPKTYRAYDSTLFEADTDEQIPTSMASIVIEHVGPATFLTSQKELSNASLLEKFDDGTLLYSHKVDEESVVACRGQNVRAKKSVTLDDGFFVVEFALKLDPIKK